LALASVRCTDVAASSADFAAAKRCAGVSCACCVGWGEPLSPVQAAVPSRHSPESTAATIFPVVRMGRGYAAQPARAGGAPAAWWARDERMQLTARWPEPEAAEVPRDLHTIHRFVPGLKAHDRHMTFFGEHPWGRWAVPVAAFGVIAATAAVTNQQAS